MKIFQIYNGFCHWQTPFKSLDETKDFPPDCIFVEAPDYVNEQWGYDDTKEGDERFIHPEPPEGWIFDDETGTFFPESDLPRLLAEAQNSKQNENKILLANFLDNHPITWIDGKQYGVTMEDQSEIQLNISQYQIQCAAKEQGQDVTPVLEWHSIHESCVPWTLENLSALVLAISDFVYPWFQRMNQYKEQIYACTTREEVAAINLDYRTDEEIAEQQAREEEARKAAEEAAASEENSENSEDSTSEDQTSTEPAEDQSTEATENQTSTAEG